MSVAIRAIKLRYADAHVRIGLDGDCAGVDLRGEDARAAFEIARPIVAWLETREPGIALRSLSLDRGKLRVLVSIDDGSVRPRVVRVDPPESAELFDLAAPLLAHLAAVAATKIAARAG